ncbi:MAG: thioredoxin family protein [Christensenellaceae bacterium]|jgi:glutaredoxin|nr:thioredoxin family protein [Christensenellaceae bacterium]
MKPITLFMFEACPYCQEALRFIEELKAENPAYAAIPFTMIDERLDPVTADKFDYYYVPTFYVGDQKLHEGASTKEKVKAVYDAALA